EHVFGNRLNSHQPYQSIRLFHGQRFLTRLAMASRPRRDYELLDLALRKACFSECGQCTDRDSFNDGRREICVRSELAAKETFPAKLIIDGFIDGPKVCHSWLDVGNLPLL